MHAGINKAIIDIEKRRYGLAEKFPAIKCGESDTDERILYAEDEKRILRNTSERLEKDGFSVDMAENGLEAWHYLESVGYDLAILDIMMPKMDGLRCCGKFGRQV